MVKMGQERRDHRRWFPLRLLPAMLVLMVPVFAHAEEYGPKEIPSSEPRDLCVVGNSLFFSADDGVHGRELWRWHKDNPDDEDGQVELVNDAQKGPIGSNPHFLRRCGEWLYFLATTAQAEEGLWVCASDGSPPQAVLDTSGVGQINHPVYLDTSGDRTFFYVLNKSGKTTLWTTALGSPKASNISAGETSFYDLSLGTVVGNESLLVNNQGGIWRVDGEGAGDGIVLPGILPMFLPGLEQLRSGVLLLASQSPDFTNLEPWVTDGSKGGTRLLKDINPGLAPSMQHMDSRIVAGGVAYFAADNGTLGNELWKTDGTPEGTVLVKDINPGVASGDPHAFCSVDGVVYFAANDGQHGTELWCTTGTEETTTLLGDLMPGVQSAEPYCLRGFKHQLWFCARSPDCGEEIFSLDKNSMVRPPLDLVPGPGDSGPNRLVPMGDRMFFTCNDVVHGEELWSTDGTPQGTRLVCDLFPGQVSPGSNPRHLTAFGTAIFFTANSAEYGEELWTSDGTTDGTHLVQDINPGSASSAPDNLASARNGLYFAARTPDAGRELWFTKGVPNETVLVKDILAGPGGADPHNVVAAGDGVYFNADDGVHGRELWYSDGTSVGTVLVKDITPGAAGSSILDVFELPWGVFFYVRRAEGNVALWTTDGTEEGTRQILTVPSPFPGWDPDNPKEIPFLCGLDPASQSAISETTLLASVVHPPGLPRGNRDWVQIEDTVYFTSNIRQFGSELCKTDGTLSGTKMVRDAYKGPASSGPTHLVRLGGRVYFIADSLDNGRTLWCSDGTEANTHPLRVRAGGRMLGLLRTYDFVPVGETLYALAYSPTGATSTPYGLVAVTPAEGDVALVEGVGTPQNTNNKFRNLCSAGECAFFTYDDNMHGEEVWAIQDKPMITGGYMLKDILAQKAPESAK